MAKKGQAEVEMKVDDKGSIRKTKKKMDALGKSTEKASKSANEYKRNADGVAQRTGNGTKDFARMSQGLGGLVAAYATVAANVFALSAAFNLLSRSADFDSMVISANNLTAATGASFLGMAKRVQEATGNQLAFADALRLTNKAAASGIDTNSLEQFTDLATKAAQTFGGTTTDSLNRMIDAVLRGRTELVNKMGIVISADEAYEKFAAGIGKTVKELTSFEKRQAITNTIIEEGNKVLGETVIDPNPFEVLGATFKDLSQDMLSFLTATEGAFTKVLSLFNENKTAVLAFASIIVGSIFKRILPAQEELVKRQKKAEEAQRAQHWKSAYNVGKALKKKQEAEQAYTQFLSKEGQIRLKSVADNIEKGTKVELKSAKGVPQSLKDVLSGKDISPKQSAALLKSVEANLRRIKEGGDLAKGSLTKLGLTKKDLIKLRTEIKILRRDTEEFGVKTVEMRRRWKVTMNKMAADASIAFQKIKAGISSIPTAFATARVQADSMGFFELFTAKFDEKAGSKFGQFAGRVAAGGAKIMAAFGWISAAVGIASILWDKFGKKLFGIKKEQEDFNNSLTESRKTFEEYINTIEDAESKLSKFKDQGVTGIGEGFIYISNSANEALAPVQKLSKELGKMINARKTAIEESTAGFETSLDLSFAEGSEQPEKLAEKLNALRKAYGGFFGGMSLAGEKQAQIYIKQALGIEATEEQLKALFEQAKAFENLPPITFTEDQAFTALKGIPEVLTKLEGFGVKSSKRFKNLVQNGILKNIDKIPEKFRDALQSADFTDMSSIKELSTILASAEGKEVGNIKEALDAVVNSMKPAIDDAKLLGNAYKELGKVAEDTEIEQKKLNASFLEIKSAKVMIDSLKNVKANLKTIVNITEGIRDEDGVLLVPGIGQSSKELEDVRDKLKEIYDLNFENKSASEMLKLIEDIENSLLNAAQNIKIFQEQQKLLEIQKNYANLVAKNSINQKDVLDAMKLQNQSRQESLEMEIKILTNQYTVASLAKKAATTAEEIKELEQNQLAVLRERIKSKKLDLKLEKLGIEIIQKKTEFIKKQEAHYNTILTSSRASLDIELESLKIVAALTGRLEDQVMLNEALAQAEKLKIDAKKEDAKRTLDLAEANAKLSKEEIQFATEQYNYTLKRLELEEKMLELKQATNTQAKLDAANERGDWEEASKIILDERFAELNRQNQEYGEELARASLGALNKGLNKFYDTLFTDDFSWRAVGETIAASMKDFAVKQLTNFTEQAILSLFTDGPEVPPEVTEIQQQTKTLKTELETTRTKLQESLTVLKNLAEAERKATEEGRTAALNANTTLKTTLENLPIRIATELAKVIPGADTRQTLDGTPVGVDANLQVSDTDRGFVSDISGQGDSPDYNMSAGSAGTSLGLQQDPTDENTQAIKASTKVMDLLASAVGDSKAAMLKQVVQLITNTATQATSDAVVTNAASVQAQASGRVQMGISNLISSNANLGNTITIAADKIAAAVSQAGAASAGAGAAGFGGGGMDGMGAMMSFMSFAGGMANGGIMSPKPLANGGIATSAQLYEIGEGRKNEAVVPLPNNREIPVKLEGSEPKSTVVNNYDFSGADAATEARLRAMIESSQKDTFNNVFREIDRGGTYAKKSGRRK